MNRDAWTTKSGRGELGFGNDVEEVVFSLTRDRERMAVVFKTKTGHYGWVYLTKQQARKAGSWLMQQGKNTMMPVEGENAQKGNA